MRKTSALLALVVILVSVVPLLSPQVSKASTETFGTSNLALRKPVTVSGHASSFSEALLNDGDLSTSWYDYRSSSGVYYAWFILDLGNVYNIGKIDIAMTQVFGYNVSTSTDGSQYSLRYSNDWAASASPVVSNIPSDALSARYIKWFGYAHWAQYVGVLEIAVFERVTSQAPTGSLGTVNLALGKTVNDSLAGYLTDSSFPGSNAVDENPSTNWVTSSSRQQDGTGAYDSYGMIRVDLGSANSIGKIVVSPSRVQGYTFFLSNTTAMTPQLYWWSDSDPSIVCTNGVYSTPKTFGINGAVSARYIWLTANVWGSPSLVTTAVNEIQVYGWNDASATPTVKPTASEASPTLPTPTSSVPEFPALIILPLAVITLSVTVALLQRKRSK
jgi:hypothetical protein